MDVARALWPPCLPGCHRHRNAKERGELARETLDAESEDTAESLTRMRLDDTCQFRRDDKETGGGVVLVLVVQAQRVQESERNVSGNISPF